MARTATIVDVAREAGCSINTVSRALNGMPGVSPRTRDKVLAAAHVLSYTPNRLARSLHGRTSRMLGLIVTDCTDPFYARLIRAVEDTAAAEGYGVILCNSAESDERETRAIQLLLESRVDGLLITPVQRGSGQIELLKSRSVPFLLLGRRFANLETDYISTDNESGARAATEHLLALGHRRLLHLTGRAEISSVAERAAGFQASLKQFGLTGEIRFGLDRDVQSGRAAAGAALSGAQPPTAIVAYNDLIALGVLHAARELGLKVPGDVSVVGFDDIELASYFEVPLTTVAQPIEEIGRDGTRALLRVLGGETASTQLLLPPRLIIRDSTAPPRAGAGRG